MNEMTPFDYGPPTVNTITKGPVFTVSKIDMDSPEVAKLSTDDLEVTTTGENSRPLCELVRPSVGCISEDERRERFAVSLGWDIPCASALKGLYAGQKVIICGGGTSLKDTLADIVAAKALDPEIKIMAVNKTAAWLLEQGIVADFCVLMDPRSHIPDYLVPHKDTKYLFDGALDGRAFDICKDHQVYLWFAKGTAGDEPFVRNLLATKYPLKAVALIPGPSTVGLRSVHLAMDILGFSTIELHGFDSCYHFETDTLWPYEKTVSFEKIKVPFTVVSQKTGDLFRCVSNPDMSRQVYEFDKMIDLLIGSAKAGTRTKLANITVAGDGAIPWMAWKNNGHATPERMLAKYGDAKAFDYSTGEPFKAARVAPMMNIPPITIEGSISADDMLRHLTEASAQFAA